jgi:RNA polymerase sigma factor (sigma-70 family)
MEVSVGQKLNIAEIVKGYSKRLTGFIRKRVDRAEDAEDILQEVFYQLAEADYLVKPIDQLTSWLFTVARNRITDLYRKKKPDFLSDLFFDEDEDPEIDALGELFEDNNDTPEIMYLRSLVMEELENTLDLLPPEQREVFEMTEFQGLSFNDISALTGQPINTLISRKRYAVLLLRERLRILYDELLNF